MSDDARRPLTEEERARIFEARRNGGLCGLCGRVLAADEPVWMERLVTDTWGWRRSPIYSLTPVGAECVSAAFRAATQGADPEPCITCARGVYYRTADARRRWAACSRRCRSRFQTAYRREGTSS